MSTKIIEIADKAINEERGFTPQEIASILSEAGDRRYEVLAIVNNGGGTYKPEGPKAVRQLFGAERREAKRAEAVPEFRDLTPEGQERVRRANHGEYVSDLTPEEIAYIENSQSKPVVTSEEMDRWVADQIRSKIGGIGGTGAVEQRRQWVENTTRKLQSAYRENRAINSGSIDVTAPLGRIVDIARPGVKVKNLLTAVPAPADANGTSYLRQTVRTNNAEFVADAGQKPTSVYTLVEVSDRLRQLAHLSESIPQRYLEDSEQLRRFLESEMLAGLDARLDDAILNGDDTAVTDEFDGLMKLSGTEVAFDTDVVKTAANVLTAQLTLVMIRTRSSSTRLTGRA